MALIKCRECGKDVSDEAESCPNCGIKLKKKKSENGAIRAVCYITDVASFILALAGYGNWFAWIPLIWAIGISIYCSSKDKEKEDINFYEKIKKENYIVFAIVFITMIIVIFARSQTNGEKDIFGIDGEYTDKTGVSEDNYGNSDYLETNNEDAEKRDREALEEISHIYMSAMSNKMTAEKVGNISEYTEISKIADGALESEMEKYMDGSLSDAEGELISEKCMGSKFYVKSFEEKRKYDLQICISKDGIPEKDSNGESYEINLGYVWPR